MIGCSSTEGSGRNTWNEECADYVPNERDWCGNNPFEQHTCDDADFVSHEMCCECGGGNKNLQDQVVADNWVVPKKHYKLSEVRMWKSAAQVSGFKVTYSVPSSYSGWPDEVHTFGSTSMTSNEEVISFSEEITNVRTCIDV